MATRPPVLPERAPRIHRRVRARPPATETPAPRGYADPDHLRRYRAHRPAARQRHGARPRHPAAADAHLPRPQQRREDRAASPRAVARGCARRARSRRRRHRLLGARWRLGLLLRQRRPVLQRHRADRRVRRRDGRDRAPDRRLQRQDRTRGMTHRRHRLQTRPGTVDFPDLTCR